MTSGNGAEPSVLTRVQGGVAHVLLNRPQARNAVTSGLARALHDALSDAAVYADLIVVRGAGGHFCAGGDVQEMARLRRQGPDGVPALLGTFGGACDLIAELPVPVVAAVEGMAVGVGFDLVASVDIAIVRDDAMLADNHASVGVSPGGWSQRLPQTVGMPRALGHLLLGDPLTGRQAAEWGLVYRSVPPPSFEAALAALVGNLAGKNRDTLTRIKRLVRGAPEPPAASAPGQHAGPGTDGGTRWGSRP